MVIGTAVCVWHLYGLLGKTAPVLGRGKYRCLRNMYFNKSLPYQYRQETICGLHFFTGFYTQLNPEVESYY